MTLVVKLARLVFVKAELSVHQKVSFLEEFIEVLLYIHHVHTVSL